MSKTNFAQSPARIKVIGLGGGGCNAITRMVRENIRGVEFIAMNSDAQALAIVEAPIRVQLGEKVSRGLGVGGDNNVGAKAAEENRDEIAQLVAGADMVFITAGMGGGTGTGSAPVVAEIAKSSGALTIAIVTRPFTFEGAHRSQVAEDGIQRLIGNVDTLIQIPNDRLLKICNSNTSVDNAFRIADDVLLHGVQAISEVITVPGLINLDFADVRSVMKDAGPAWMSIGYGSGRNRATDAARDALSSPLLDVTLAGSRGVLYNVVGGEGLSLAEVNQAAKIIQEAVDPDANIIFGVAQDTKLDKDVRITLIATGFYSELGQVGVRKDDEFNRFLKGIKSEEEMDMPSFLRRPMFNQQRKQQAQSASQAQTSPGKKPSSPSLQSPAM
jgi:cell division protein FtsZ